MSNDAKWFTLALISSRLDAKMKLQFKDAESKEEVELTKKLRKLCIEEKKMLERFDQHSKFLKKEIFRIQRRTPSVPRAKPVRIFHQGDHGKQTLSDIRASVLSQMSSCGAGPKRHPRRTPEKREDVSLPLLKLLVNDKELHPTDSAWSSITPGSSISRISGADGYSADVDTSFSSVPVSISVSIPEEDRIATEKHQEGLLEDEAVGIEKNNDPDIVQDEDDEPAQFYEEEDEELDFFDESTSSLPSIPEFASSRDFVLRVDNRLTRHTNMHLYKFKDDEILKKKTSINRRSTPADVRQRKAENHCKCIEQIQLRREYLKAAKRPKPKGIGTLAVPRKELKIEKSKTPNISITSVDDMKVKVPKYMMKNLSKTEGMATKDRHPVRKKSSVSIKIERC